MAQYKYAGVSLDQKGIRILVQRAFRAEATWATRELRKHIMREHVGSGGKRSNQGAKIEGSPGTEWFMTSPAVVEKIYKKHVS